MQPPLSMWSALVPGSSSLGSFKPCPQTLCCVLQDKTLHPHSSQVYEWVPVNLTLGVMMDYCDAEDNVD